VQTLIRRSIGAEAARAVLTSLPVVLVAFDPDLAYRVGVMEQATRQEGLSLGDRACLALAERHGVPALTADRAWAAAGARLGIRVELIR
jgi:ribonuclease VapC